MAFLEKVGKMVVVDAVTVPFIENELPISEKFHVTATWRASTFQPALKKEPVESSTARNNAKHG